MTDETLDAIDDATTTAAARRQPVATSGHRSS